MVESFPGSNPTTFLGLIPIPFCSTMVLVRNRSLLPLGVGGGFVEKIRIPGKNRAGEASPHPHCRFCSRDFLGAGPQVW